MPKWHRALGHATSAAVTLQLGYALARMISDLMAHRETPAELLQGALVIWSMNIIVFASWYGRLDAGGPHGRSRRGMYCGGAFPTDVPVLSAWAKILMMIQASIL